MFAAFDDDQRRLHLNAEPAAKHYQRTENSLRCALTRVSQASRLL